MISRARNDRWISQFTRQEVSNSQTAEGIELHVKSFISIADLRSQKTHGRRMSGTRQKSEMNFIFSPANKFASCLEGFET
jgi:hypothetical protein